MNENRNNIKLLSTRNYFKKRLTNFLFNEKNYNRIKLFKIIFDYKIGKPYDKIIPLLPEILNEDDVILDIGANMGQYACRLNQLVPKGKVFSFEPVLENYRALVKMKSILKLNNVEILKLAVSDKKGKDKIYIPVINKSLIDGTQAVLEGNKKTYDNVNYNIEIVETDTIDNIVEEKNIEKISFIKIDTEGAELRVLKGALGSLKRFKPLLQLEIGHDNTGLNLIYEEGYLPFYIFDKKFIEAEKAIDAKSRLGDVILIHNDKKNIYKTLLFA